MDTPVEYVLNAIQELQQDVKNLLKQKADTLWNAEDIANYFRLEKKTVQAHYIDSPTFPEPVKLLTGGRRWVPKEVIAWAMKNR